MILDQLHSMGHEILILEETRRSGRKSWSESAFYRDPKDGLRTLWYDPHKGFARLLTWPLDRIFRPAFEGRNLVHRMWAVSRAVHFYRPDLIVCTDGFTYAIPAALLKAIRLINKPLFVSYIGGDILDCPEADVGKRRTPLVSWLIRTSVRHIDMMRPLCKSLADILVREGADPRRIQVLPIQLTAHLDTLDAIRADRSGASDRVRKRYGFSENDRILATLSGNQRGKGLHLLADQWSRIVAAHPNVRWLLCGPIDPWVESQILPRLRSTGVADRVTLTGALRGTDVFEHLAAAELHINPTLCEGLNMVTVEAAAVGTPTITSNGAGIADWVERLDCGRVVPAGSGQALGDAVIEALRDKHRLLTWQMRCYRMAPDFDVSLIARRLVELFHILAAPSADPQRAS